MAERRLNNALYILDCLDLIRSYKEYVKPEESELVEPSETARLVMRRALSRSFGGFNIRKNQNTYALRCDDEAVYKALLVTNSIVNNSSIYTKLSPEIRQRVSAATRESSRFLDELTSSGITWSFKDDRRFFIYVNFEPQRGSGNAARDASNFRRNSMRTRVEAIVNAGTAAASIRFDEIFDKLSCLIEENSVYSIYDVGEVSDDFLAFYFSKSVEERSYCIKPIYLEYMRNKEEERAQRELERQREQQAELVRRMQREPVRVEHADIGEATTISARIISRPSRAASVTAEPVTIPVMEPLVEPRVESGPLPAGFRLVIGGSGAVSIEHGEASVPEEPIPHEAIPIAMEEYIAEPEIHIPSLREIEPVMASQDAQQAFNEALRRAARRDSGS